MKLQCDCCDHKFEGKPTDTVEPCPNCGIPAVLPELPGVKPLAACRYVDGVRKWAFVRLDTLEELS